MHKRILNSASQQPSMDDVAGMVTKINEAFVGFKDRTNERLSKVAQIESELGELANRVAAGRDLGGFGGHADKADRLAFATFGRTGRIQAAMSTQSDPDGGFLVPDTIDREISRLARDLSPMRRVSRIVTVQNGRYSKLVSRNGSAATWRGETSAPTETQGLDLAEISPPEGELTAMPKVTQWLLDDSTFDVAGELAQDIADAFAEKEGAAFVNGDGISKPRGFLTADAVANASWAWGKLGFLKTGDASGFASASTTVSPADALVDVVYGLKTSYRQNGRWLMNSETAGVVRKFKNADGNPIWTDSIAQGQPPLLLGYPVELCEDMPAVAAGNFPIAFGDFQRGYLILDRLGTRVLRDPYSSKPYVLFYTTKRVGGAVLDYNAIKLLKVAA